MKSPHPRETVEVRFAVLYGSLLLVFGLDMHLMRIHWLGSMLVLAAILMLIYDAVLGQ